MCRRWSIWIVGVSPFGQKLSALVLLYHVSALVRMDLSALVCGPARNGNFLAADGGVASVM
jgi:hypothetical protein